jgi:hypothetical protein
VIAVYFLKADILCFGQLSPLPRRQLCASISAVNEWTDQSQQRTSPIVYYDRAEAHRAPSQCQSASGDWLTAPDLNETDMTLRHAGIERELKLTFSAQFTPLAEQRGCWRPVSRQWSAYSTSPS